jgi:putative transposase
MDEDRRRETGLFRYTLIRDAADLALSKAQRGRLLRVLADREHLGPDGRLVRVSRTTLGRWVRAYRRGGFDALVPRPKVVPVRTPAETLELAFALKRERPERTAAQVHEIMLTSSATGDDVPGLRTLQTHLARAGLNVRADGRSPGKVYGRFEAAARNELWTGDGLHGPKLSGPAARRAVLLAFIDDHSRLLVGWRWGTGEDVFRLEAALRAGLMSRGVPAAILVDRGSAFVSSQLLRACAVLGVKLIHASPRAATTKGKIERFFRTVRDQFLVEIDDGVELAELNRLFSAWLEVVYHRRTIRRPDRRRLTGSTLRARRHSRPRRCSGKRSCGARSGRSRRPRRCRCTATNTRLTRRSWVGRSSWCSTRSTSPGSRSATSTARWASPSHW